MDTKLAHQSMKIGFRGKYDFVCGIGQFCATAQFLKRNGLRRMSGPLDWVALEGGRGLEIATGLICTDFSGFMEKGSLTRIDRSLSPLSDPRCDYYRDEKSGVTFFHDFPIGVPMEMAYGGAKAMYDRRIARFYATVKASSRTLLVFHTRCDHPTKECLASSVTRLRQKLGEHVDLLVIEDVPRLEEPYATEPVPGVFHVRCWFFKPEMHWVYGDMALNDSVYRKIPLGGQLRRGILNVLSRIRAAAHFSRERRHEERNRLLG